MVSIIQMMNHYPNGTLRRGNTPLGQYCAFGYFDAIRIQPIKSKLNFVWENIDVNSMEQLDGTFIMQQLGCLFQDNDKEREKKFWEGDVEESEEVENSESKKLPYCFFTMIRTPQSWGDESLQNVITEEKQKCANILFYTTYEHVEVIAVYRTNSYRDGMRKIKELTNKLKAEKVYSIFTVREGALIENNPNIANEMVNIRLTATMKTDGEKKNVDSFLEQLKAAFWEKEGTEKLHVYDILGGMDLLIEANNVSMKRILPLYAMGRLLTHTSAMYQKAFCNIETRFCLKEEGDYCAKTDTDGSATNRTATNRTA